LLDTPSDGEYVLNDNPVENLSLSQRARIRNREVGFIFQSFNLIGDLTVYENVELPLTYRGMPSSERKKRVTDALERVGMGHRSKHLPVSCRAASSSAWQWPGQWGDNQASSSPMRADTAIWTSNQMANK